MLRRGNGVYLSQENRTAQGGISLMQIGSLAWHLNANQALESANVGQPAIRSKQGFIATRVDRMHPRGLEFALCSQNDKDFGSLYHRS